MQQHTLERPAKLWNRNFTMVVIGQIISIFGNVILRFALNVYVLELTGSAAVFGLVMALSVIPPVLLSPIGGIIADRVNRQHIMVALDFTTAGLLAAFGLLLTPGNAVPLITVLLMLLATISAFYAPSVQTSVPLLQQGDNLVRGNAVVNGVNMVANLVGPVLGAAVYGLFGVASVVWVAVGCFAASAVLELFIRIPFARLPRAGGLLATVKQDFGDSLWFVTRTRPEVLRFLLALMGVNLFISSMLNVGSGFMVMTVLGFDSGMFGITSSLAGAGGLLGGLLAGALAGRFKVRNLYWMLVAIPLGVGPIALAFALNLAPFAIFVTIAACTAVFSTVAAMFNIFTVSAVQGSTPAGLLGKVFGLVATLCMAAMPIGNALYGFVFDAFTGHLPAIILATAFITAAIGLSLKKPCRALGEAVAEQQAEAEQAEAEQAEAEQIMEEEDGAEQAEMAQPAAS